METVDLQSDGVTSSRIGLGTWAIGGWMWGGTDEAESVRAIQSAPDRGITLIDTAPVYGFGRSEEIVGRAVAEGNLRDRVVLATKCALEWDDQGGVRRNATRQRLLQEADDSLRRLRTDVIDLLQVHWPDPNIDVRETAEAMAELKNAGKIRAVGVSNFTPAQMDQMQSIVDIDVVQNPYNLFERDIESDVLPWAERHNSRLLAYGALCRGLLAGRMYRDRQFEGDDLRQSDPKFMQPRFDQYLAAVSELDTFARERYGKTVLDLAIRWILDAYPASIALWGARRPDQLDSVAEIGGWSLDDEARRTVGDIVDRHVTDPVGPEFMAPPARTD
ncbi:aldo/keto reductase [Salinisphaera sp. USBA-960]|uniref:aldo/keto reductase n=1 Tax=Salinisphaera orenii TaxID=856731 RepID=UPI000DBE433B|nr:aldo/keto reductase [Salifodinibacter halophilus]NNC25430.1 aldo/keto reductase [Salifodinibacter halophilus]